MNSGLQYNDLVKDFFEKNGIKCIDGSDIIPKEPGEKNPDFLCSDKHGDEFWVEVKSLEEQKEVIQSGKIFIEARDRLGTCFDEHKIKGFSHLFTSGDANSHHLKKIVHVINWAKKESIIDFSLDNDAMFIVPVDQSKSGFVYFQFESQDGSKIDYISVISINGKYGLPITVNAKYNQEVTLCFSDGARKTTNYLGISSFYGGFDAVLIMKQSDDNMRIAFSSSGDGAHKDVTVKKSRQVIKEANKQHSNALNYRDIPTLTLVFKDSLIDMDERNLVISAYGDLTYSFDPNNFQNGETIIGRNGAFREGKNSSTSAFGTIMDGEALIVHNIYAKKSFPKKIFKAKECIPEIGESYSFN